MMAVSSEQRNRVRQVKAIMSVLVGRIKRAESGLTPVREKLEEAERYHDVCQVDFDRESQTLQAIIAHLGSPDVSTSPQCYARMLTERDIVVRDLDREKFMLDNAALALESARQMLVRRLAEITLLRTRYDALAKQLTTLKNLQQREIELLSETEVDELMILRQLLPESAHP
jgi:hypothetical protein